jgi:hypothetical protein
MEQAQQDVEQALVAWQVHVPPVTATSGTINGTKYRLVKKPRTVRSFRPFTISARVRPNISCRNTSTPTHWTLKPRLCQNSGSSNSRNR